MPRSIWSPGRLDVGQRRLEAGADFGGRADPSAPQPARPAFFPFLFSAKREKIV
jgi:hypothetical protein